ncbi:MAG TPA: DUF4476 domain-containing protein [Ignavibacteria bacterium]|nr:DUF4476 domain-containing protein [Ignavibacteria bacterium]HMQ99571.1 DUF4476 domain-containing protein [Ignavibacteria bacterium]
MRKNFLAGFLLIVFLSACVFSQSSYLQLSLFDDGNFTVTLDNSSLSAGNYAEFDLLPAGEHSLKVTRVNAEPSVQGDVVFDGKIKIPSGTDLYAVIDEYNTFVVYKKKKYGFNRMIPLGEFVVRCGDGKTPTSDKDQYSATDECRYKVMKKDDFKDLKSTINNRNFESYNSTIVKSAIDNNYFTSEQVVELLRYFTFEDTKLEIAKYSYKKVCDQGNFFKVYDAFDFESSVTELKNYISGK